MIRFSLVVLMLSFGCGALARVDQTAPVRFGSKSIKTQMSEAAVREIAGEPTDAIDLHNRYGARVGRKLVYRIKGYNKRTVIVVIEDGLGVVRLNECMGVKADDCN